MTYPHQPGSPSFEGGAAYEAYCKEMEMERAERDLLTWLGQDDFSQYGECHGKALNSLIAKGLAQVHNGQEHQSGFIAQGRGDMYRAVSLTDAGRAALATGKCDV